MVVGQKVTQQISMESNIQNIKSPHYHSDAILDNYGPFVVPVFCEIASHDTSKLSLTTMCYRILEFFAACIFHGWAWNQDFRGWNFADEGSPKHFAFFAPCYKAMYKKCMLLI